jgi:competence protein ComEC
MSFHPQPLFFLVLGLVAGTLVPASEVSGYHAVSLGLGLGIGLIAVVRPGRVSLTALIVAAGAAGTALAAGERSAYEQRLLPQALGEIEGSVLLEGLVAEDPAILEGEMRFDLQATRIVSEGSGHDYVGRIRVFVRSGTAAPFARTERILKGDRVRAWVDLRRPEPVRTPGGFDQLEWAMRRGLHGFATCKSERLLKVTPASRGDRTWIDRARDRLKNSWRHVDDPQDRAVTASMVMGDEGALDETTRGEFRSAGLLHLLVVSGSQVAALILGLRRVMPLALRISWPGCLLECLVLITYCVLAGAEDSIVRATVMAMAFAVAVRVDLHRGGANFLAASALVLLALRPLDAADPGAQMSFAATLALVSFAGALSLRLTSRRVPGILADVAAATLVASIAVTPLSLWHFHRLSLIALPANLLAAPLAVLLLYGSLATAILDSVLTPLAPLGGELCGLAASALRALAHHAASFDPDWRGPSPPLVLLIGAIGLVTASGWRRVTLPAAGLLASLTLSGLPKGDGRVHLWFLDVGQGDSILIETPSGRVAVIDAGPAFQNFDAGERVVSEALWALGHVRLAFLGVTHRHADHEGGAPFLARHFDPQFVYVNGPSAPMKSFKTTTVRRGDSWRVDGVDFRVLGPDPGWLGALRDENARSLVIEVRYGVTAFLLLGDAGLGTEALLELRKEGYDVVKVGHHGAATSSSAALVRRTHPQIAVMSVGSRNRFSHPSAAVVARWAGAGARVFRTDRDHTLRVASDGSAIEW